MNALLPSRPGVGPAAQSGLDALPALIDRAAQALAGARSSADVLEARDQASAAYDEAKRIARLGRAKGAHDVVVAAALRVQGDALLIESHAKIRLADEYDSAVDRGEVARQGQSRNLKVDNGNVIATLADIGLRKDDIFRARRIRDAETAEPGIVQRIVAERLDAGLEPSRNAVLRAADRHLQFSSDRDLDAYVKERRAGRQAVKAEKRAEREEGLGERTRAAAAALGRRRYNVILADPEWQHDTWSAETGMDRSAANHYPTSPLAVIQARDVASIAADDCLLALWATVPHLADAFCVLDAWGFARFDRDAETGFLALDKTEGRYVSSGSWTKYKPDAGIGMGYWFRVDHEILLIATRGQPPAPAMGDQARSVFDVPASRVHSQKPELVCEILESYFPNLPKIELNRRGAPRPGWDAWGNEADGAAA